MPQHDVSKSGMCIHTWQMVALWETGYAPEDARTKVAAEFPTHQRSCAGAVCEPGDVDMSAASSRTTSFTHGPGTVFTNACSSTVCNYGLRF